MVIVKYRRDKCFDRSSVIKYFQIVPLTLPVPIPDEEKKLGFIKPFEAPQRSVNIKI